MDKPAFCPFCGQRTSPNASACAACGRSLGETSAPAPAVPQAVTFSIPSIRLGSGASARTLPINARTAGIAIAALVVVIFGWQFYRGARVSSDVQNAARTTVTNWTQLQHLQLRNDTYQITNQQDTSANVHVQVELQAGEGPWVENATELALARIGDQWLSVDSSLRFITTPSGQATAQAAQVQGAATAQAAQVQAVAAQSTAQAQTQATAVGQRIAAATAVAASTAIAQATSTQVAAQATQGVVTQATQQAAAQATTVATLKVANAQDITPLIRAAIGSDNSLLVGRSAQTNDYASAQDFVISKDGWPTTAANIQQAIIDQLKQLQFQRVYTWQQPQVNTDPESLLIQVYVFSAGGTPPSVWNDYLLSEDQAQIAQTYGQGQGQRQLPISEIGQNGYLMCVLCSANSNQSRFYYGFSQAATSGQSKYFVHIVGNNVGIMAASRNGPGAVDIAQATARALVGALGRS